MKTIFHTVRPLKLSIQSMRSDVNPHLQGHGNLS